MKLERKKDLKKLMTKFSEETRFMSSTHSMYENKNFKKLENIATKEQEKKRLFKLIKSQLNNNPFLFKIMETITGDRTVIKDEDRGKINKIIGFWLEYQY